MVDSSTAVDVPEARARLLDDLPVDIDQFAGKGHTAVAKAIASVVCSEPGGRVLGLQGPWGSGKSTIIRLLEKEIEERKKSSKDQVNVFTFDAWAHQGDPLRRSFLEQLLDQLADDWHWILETDRDALKGRLSGKTSKDKTKTSARLTPEGLAASLAVLVVPLGAAAFANHFHSWHRPFIFAGLVLLLAPILVVLGFFATGAVARKIAPTSRAAKLQRFSFFAKEQKTETETERIEGGQPTSVEFEDIFAKALAGCLTDGKRLVIVLDNLDRVDQPAARELFATMQTFTGTSNRRRGEEWTRRVWTLVPFDLAGLEKLWQEVDSAPIAGDDTGYAPSDTAAAFFEKIFEVRLSVPPMVLSDWHAYLKGLLVIALPGYSNEEHATVVRLRSLYPTAYVGGLVSREQPTPRQLKQYVNQIVSVVLQRTDIRLSSIAFFALLQRDGRDLANLLQDELVAPASLASFLGEEVGRDVAALYFGTDPSLAQQLRLGSRVEQALTSGDSESIVALAQDSGFIETMDSLSIDRWTEAGATELIRAAAALNGANLLADERLVGWIGGPFRYQVSRVPAWRVADQMSGTGLAAVCVTLGGEVAEQVLERIETVPAEGGSLNDALTGVAVLGKDLKASRMSIESLRVDVKVDENETVKAAAFFARQTGDTKIHAILSVQQPTTDFVSLIAAAATDENDPLAARDALVTLNAGSTAVDPAALTAKLADRMRNEDFSSPQMQGVVALLDHLAVPPTREVTLPIFKDLVNDGTLAHHLSRANQSGWYPQAASVSMLMLWAAPTSTEPPAIREAPTGVQVLRTVTTNPVSNEPLAKAQTEWLVQNKRWAAGYLLTRLQAEPGIQPWVDYQLKALRETGQLLLATDALSKDWGVLKGALEPDAFLDLCAQELGRAAHRSTLLADDTPIELALDLSDSLARVSDTAVKSEVAGWMTQLVTSAGKADWSTALGSESGGPLIELGLREAGTKASNDLMDALLEHARGLQIGSAVWKPDSASFKKLADLLNQDTREVLASQLCAGLEGMNGDFQPDFLAVYSDFLQESPKFREHQKLLNVIDQLVAHDKWSEVEWFVDLADQHSDTLAKTDRVTEYNNLKGRVEEKIRASQEDLDPVLNRLAIHLGVDLPKQRVEAEGDDEGERAPEG